VKGKKKTLIKLKVSNNWNNDCRAHGGAGQIYSNILRKEQSKGWGCGAWKNQRDTSFSDSEGPGGSWFKG